jgi:hypothetical protein
MARDFGKVRTAFWSDDKVIAWPERLKFVALYLLTSPHTNAIGCFRVPAQYIAADTGLTVGQVNETLDALVTEGFIARCAKTSFVWLRNYLEHNGIENGKVGTHCIRLAKALPLSLPFLKEFEAALKAALALINTEWIGLGYPIDTLSEPNRTPEPEPEPLPEPEPEKKPLASPVTPPASQSPLDFRKELWSRGVHFLKSQGLSDPDARSMLGKWRKNHGDLEVLNALAAAEGAAASEAIPYVTAVLSGKAKANGRNQGQHGPTDHPLGVFGQLAEELRGGIPGKGGREFDA